MYFTIMRSSSEEQPASEFWNTDGLTANRTASRPQEPCPLLTA